MKEKKHSWDPGRLWTVDGMDSPHSGTTEPARGPRSVFTIRIAVTLRSGYREERVP